MPTQTGKQIVFARYPQPPFEREFLVEYDFLPGFNRSIHQKNVRAIHKVTCSREKKQGRTKKYRILEISTASEVPLGRALSAFNLPVTLVCNGETVTRTVEQWYQSSKVYQRGDGRDEYGRFNSLFNLPGGRLVMPKFKHNRAEYLRRLLEKTTPKIQSGTPGKQIEQFIEQQTKKIDLDNRNRNVLLPWLESILIDTLGLSNNVITKVITAIDTSKTGWSKGTLKKVLGQTVRGEFEHDRNHRIFWVRRQLTDDVIRARGYDPESLHEEQMTVLQKENIKATQREQEFKTKSVQLRSYVAQTFRLLHAVWFPEKSQQIDIWVPENRTQLMHLVKGLELYRKVGTEYRKIIRWADPNDEYQICDKRIQYWLLSGVFSDTNTKFHPDTWKISITNQNLRTVKHLLPELDNDERLLISSEDQILKQAHRLRDQLLSEIHQLHLSASSKQSVDDWIQKDWNTLITRWKDSNLEGWTVIEGFKSENINEYQIQEWLRTGQIIEWHGAINSDDGRLSLSWRDMQTIEGANVSNRSIDETFKKQRKIILQQLKKLLMHQKLSGSVEYWIEHKWDDLLEIWRRYSDSGVAIRLESQEDHTMIAHWNDSVDLNFMMKGTLTTSQDDDPFRYNLLEQADHLWKWIQGEIARESCDCYHDESFESADEVSIDHAETKESKESRAADKVPKQTEIINHFAAKLLPWLQGSIVEFDSKERPLLERSRQFRAQQGLGRVQEYRLMQCESVWTIEEHVDEFCLFTWLYWKGLQQREGTLDELLGYDAFTDVYFNRHRRLMNCQARAAAMAAGLCDAQSKGHFDAVLQSPTAFKAFMREAYASIDVRTMQPVKS